jgi:hypothetical protein
VAELNGAVAWSTLFGLVVALRLLDTRPGRRFLRARFGRLTTWWAARQSALPAVDAELDELSLVLRRQQLTAAIERLRRILATDEYMSATRQIANRIAYRGLLHDLENTPDVLYGMHDDGMHDDTTDRWAATVLAVQSGSYDSRRAAAAETLEIGWRH